MDDLLLYFQLEESALGHLTASVQFGFIAGTLVFAFLTVADRFQPSRVFFACAIAGAIFNLGTLWEGNTLWSLAGFRFLTGFCLAGIYPVGMKIAADYFEKGLGKSLGFLVGALVIGTAFPHFLKGFTSGVPWKWVLILTSSLAGLGGFMMLLLVPAGPYRSPAQKLDLSALIRVFRNPPFRSAAFGYFGHMWELYAFWAFVPVMLAGFQGANPGVEFQVPILSFVIIGVGGPACVLGGFLSQRFGEKRVAGISLGISGLCCLLSPLVLGSGSIELLMGFLILWGAAVVADSPLFSTLVANNTEKETKGTALTIVNCIGFSITIFSIQLTGWLTEQGNPSWAFLALAVGPALGLIALFKKQKPTLGATS